MACSEPTTFAGWVRLHEDLGSSLTSLWGEPDLFGKGSNQRPSLVNGAFPCKCAQILHGRHHPGSQLVQVDMLLLSAFKLFEFRQDLAQLLLRTCYSVR